jgi:streptogrisin D
LAGELGPDRTGGVYFDQKTERMVVTVTDAAAASRVVAAGGVAKRVIYSTATLKAVTSALNKAVEMPGTSWGTDIDGNRINFIADSRVTALQLAKLKRTIQPYGGAVRLSRIAGTLRADGPVNGGKYIRSDDGGSVRPASTYVTRRTTTRCSC